MLGNIDGCLEIWKTLVFRPYSKFDARIKFCTRDGDFIDRNTIAETYLGIIKGSL